MKQVVILANYFFQNFRPFFSAPCEDKHHHFWSMTVFVFLDIVARIDMRRQKRHIRMKRRWRRSSKRFASLHKNWFFVNIGKVPHFRKCLPKAELRQPFSTCVYCILLRFQRNYPGWLKPITLKTHQHAVSARWKRLSQLSLTT